MTFKLRYNQIYQLKTPIFWLHTGLNIILISRTHYKLQNVAAEIEEKYSGVKTKIIDVDFAKEDSTSYIPKIEESIKAPWPILLTSCFLCQGNV